MICIAGDNLGSHMIGGFKQNFSASHICRYCDMTIDRFRGGERCEHITTNRDIVKQLSISNRILRQLSINVSNAIQYSMSWNFIMSHLVCPLV